MSLTKRKIGGTQTEAFSFMAVNLKPVPVAIFL